MSIVRAGQSGNILPRNGCARLIPDALPATASSAKMADLLATIPWQAETLMLYGKAHRVPRLVSWHGDAAYTYSGVRHDPLPWTQTLIKLRMCVEALTGTVFNAVLLNLYRDGNDSMGWHADDEPSLGPEPAIASLSLGATRRFLMRPRHRRGPSASIGIDLSSGSLLIMKGETQTYWQHAIPKTRRAVGPRINLTFRHIVG